jgi:hypothetical protein
MSSADATASAALPAAGVSAATTAAAAPVPPATAASASADGGDNADEVAIELEPRDDADYETDDQSDNGACELAFLLTVICATTFDVLLPTRPQCFAIGDQSLDFVGKSRVSCVV